MMKSNTLLKERLSAVLSRKLLNEAKISIGPTTKFADIIAQLDSKNADALSEAYFNIMEGLAEVTHILQWPEFEKLKIQVEKLFDNKGASKIF